MQNHIKRLKYVSQHLVTKSTDIVNEASERSELFQIKTNILASKAIKPPAGAIKILRSADFLLVILSSLWYIPIYGTLNSNEF